MLDRLRVEVSAAEASFGPEDHRTLAARLALGREFRERCRDEEAYAELAPLTDAYTRTLGPEHPDTLIAQHEAALSCYHLHLSQVNPDTARLPEAVRQLEEVAATRDRLFGPAHPDTLAIWTNLAAAYTTAERIAEADALDERLLTGWKQIVANREREHGPNAPDTQYARLRLTDLSEPDISRTLRRQVVTSWGQLSAERSTTLGPIHPDTIDAREQHAYSHRRLRQRDDEARLMEEIAADLLNALGPADPRTLHAQARLSARYFEGAYDPAAAIKLGEQIIDDIHRVSGPQHDDLRLVRAVLMLSYHAAGHTKKRSRFGAASAARAAGLTAAGWLPRSPYCKGSRGSRYRGPLGATRTAHSYRT
jgi:hypothetical protein